jgi:hypothetical protein
VGGAIFSRGTEGAAHGGLVVEEAEFAASVGAYFGGDFADKAFWAVVVDVTRGGAEIFDDASSGALSLPDADKGLLALGIGFAEGIGVIGCVLNSAVCGVSEGAIVTDAVIPTTTEERGKEYEASKNG